MGERAATIAAVAQSSEQRRREILTAHGARGAVVDELLEFNRRRVDQNRPRPSFPLDDEPHIEAWQRYAAEGRDLGVWQVLRPRFAQLGFPVRAGISGDEAYRRATLRGERVGDGAGEGLALERPERIVLDLHPSIAGTVPILTAAVREDFVALVRALTARNEPLDIPESMGACLVSGLNNWDRIHAHRVAWEAADPEHRREGAWAAEFKRLVPHKELYQDRLIILSRGPYSDVDAEDLGLQTDTWIEQSYRIRREHECTHYFTLRAFGALQHNILEELVADFVGVIRGLGGYRSEVALRFLGLEDHPDFRSGGRLANYRGDPPLGDAAFEVLCGVTHAAVLTLERFVRSRAELVTHDESLARVVFALTTLTLEELAAEDAVARIDAMV